MKRTHDAKNDDTTTEGDIGATASSKAEADRTDKELNVKTSPSDLRVLTPGYEDAAAAGVQGGAATASECTFPGCINGRQEFSYMCDEHTAAHASALEAAQH